jgi:hypothetical protein
MAEWARIVNTTIRKYIRKEEVNTLRNRKLTALLKEKGRITYNHSGESLDWKVRYKQAPLMGFADADTLTFPRRTRRKTANLDWRGYALAESMTQKEKLMNRSTEAIIKLYSSIAEDMMEEAGELFGDELYIDGNATGNSKRFHGIESFLGGTTADGTADVALNADTYAGINCALGNYGGTWSGTWPNGQGDSEYDFWTPVLVNYLSSGIGGSGDTWLTQGVEALRFGIIKCQRNKSKKGALDLILLTSQLYEGLLNQLDSKERFVSRPGRNEGSLAKLGFTDVLNFDGVDISWEYGVPATIGYGFNMDKMELCSLQSQLFVPEGPEYDMASASWRFALHCYGNIKYNPRHFMKLDDYAT